MILTFADRETERLWHRSVVRFLDTRIQRTALRKLEYLNVATSLNDLKVPPVNRLEQLKGNRSGQYSIRINDQWRICFRWTQLGAADVEIVDYH